MATPCKIRIVRPLNGVYPLYQPTVGEIYEAEYVPPKPHSSRRKMYESKAFCVVDIGNKKIVVRPDEYEMIGGDGGG